MAVDWHSDMDNIADCKVKASRGQVGSDENIAESGVLVVVYPLFLLHVRGQVHLLI